NSGNASIPKLIFDIEIPGRHEQYLAEVVVRDDSLREAVEITWRQTESRINPRCQVIVSPFLNSGEAFEVLIYFDNTVDNCKVYCRMKDVRSKVRAGEHKSLRNAIAESTYILGVLGAVFVLLASAISLVYLYF